MSTFFCDRIKIKKDGGWEIKETKKRNREIFFERNLQIS
jgi:hypothetical protein